MDQLTFGRRINEDERNGLMSRMSSSQREVYSKAKTNLTNLKGLVPEKGTRGGFERISSSGKSSRPETAIDRLSKKINKLQKGTRPKGLIAINKQIKSLKPKKIRFAKVKSVEVPLACPIVYAPPCIDCTTTIILPRGRIIVVVQSISK